MEKRKPRILLLNFEQAGIGSSALLAAEALSRNPGLEVLYLYSEMYGKSPTMQGLTRKIPSRGVPMPSRRYRLAAYLQILYHTVKFSPDVVHDLCGTQYRKNAPLWPFFATFSRLVMTEPVASPHDAGHLVRRLIGKMGYRLARKLVVFGPETYKNFLQTGMPSEKVFLSRLGHKGFYADRVEERPKRDPNTILFFGEFRPHKGFERLASIADEVKRRWPGAKFVVAGASQFYRDSIPFWSATVDRVLSELRKRPYIQVREEYIPDREVAGYFMRAGMVILPYSEANQSGVLLTAMALGCPVVASPVGDIPSVIQSGKNGLLCHPEVESFAAAIGSLLENPAHATTLAAQAKEDAEQKFSWEKIVQEYPREVYGLPLRAWSKPLEKQVTA